MVIFIVPTAVCCPWTRKSSVLCSGAQDQHRWDGCWCASVTPSRSRYRGRGETSSLALQGDSRLRRPACLWEPSCCWRCEASLWTRNWSQRLLPQWKVGIKAWLQFVGSQAVLGREQTSGITLKDLFHCLVPEIKHSSTSPLAMPAQQARSVPTPSCILGTDPSVCGWARTGGFHPFLQVLTWQVLWLPLAHLIPACSCLL